MSTTLENLSVSTSVETTQINNFNTKYGSEITDSEITQYMDEISTEQIIPDQDIPIASKPISDAAQNDFYENDGLIDSGFPSGIPKKIDKLYKFKNAVVPGTTADTQAVLLLKNKLTESISITGGYNAICVDLDTCGYVLTIDKGSSLAAL